MEVTLVSYSTLMMHMVGTVVWHVGFWDDDERQFHFFEFRDGQDPVWNFLQFLRSHYQNRIANLDIWVYKGAQRENRVLLSKLMEKGDRLRTCKLNVGLQDVSWQLRPDLKSGKRVHFRDAVLINDRPTEFWAKTFNLTHEVPVPEQGETVTRAHCRTECQLISNVLKCLNYNTQIRALTPTTQWLGATALSVYTTNFPYLAHAPYSGKNLEMEDVIRAATYPARNEVYKRYGENIHHHDVKFMYPSCYDAPIPVGNLREVTKKNIDRGTLALVTFKIPKDMYIGPIPKHMKQGNVCFPTGEFTDWYDMYEVRRAIQEPGVDITIREQWECEEAIVLKEFADMMWRLRNTDPTFDEFWKLIADALQAKFGATRWHKTYRHVTQIDDLEGWDLEDNVWQILSQPKESKARQYNLPLIPMRVRAVARCRHLDFLLEAKKHGDVYYSDNDSVFSDYKFLTSNPVQMGELDYKGFMARCYFIYQKLYGLAYEDGAFQAVNAGYTDQVHLLEDDFKKLLNGETVPTHETRMSGLKDIITNAKLEEKVRRTTLKGGYPESRVYEGNDSRPHVLGD